MFGGMYIYSSLMIFFLHHYALLLGCVGEVSKITGFWPSLHPHPVEMHGSETSSTLIRGLASGLLCLCDVSSPPCITQPLASSPQSHQSPTEINQD